MLKRITTAIVLISLSLLAIFYLPNLYFALLTGFALGCAVWELFNFGKMVKLWHKIAYLILLFIPCWYSLVALQAIAIRYLLFLLLLVWGTDTGGYCIGKFIGGRKLLPSISPKKTIAGFIGGIFFAQLVVFIFSFFLELNLIKLMFFGLIISLSTVIGDLLESMLKRKAGIKDSGSLLPGHGGMLDRIDSLLVAAPVFILLLKLFG